MHNPTNDPLSGWNDPQPWYTSTTGHTEQPPPRRNAAATLGRVVGYVATIALCWACVVVVSV